MKKIISVLLAVMMLFSAVALTSSAVIDDCGNHDEAKGEDCHCCVNCPNLPANLILNCAKQNGVYAPCCGECSGIFDGIDSCGCDCGCEVCTRLNNSLPSDDEPVLDDVITDKDRENFVDGFQAILKRISDVFDRFFDAIFEFLRLDQILGRN